MSSPSQRKYTRAQVDNDPIQTTCRPGSFSPCPDHLQIRPGPDCEVHRGCVRGGGTEHVPSNGLAGTDCRAQRRKRVNRAIPCLCAEYTDDHGQYSEAVDPDNTTPEGPRQRSPAQLAGKLVSSALTWLLALAYEVAKAFEFIITSRGSPTTPMK